MRESKEMYTRVRGNTQKNIYKKIVKLTFTQFGADVNIQVVGRNLGGYTGARTDTTQQSGQTPDKEVAISHSTVYVSDYTENRYYWNVISQQRPTVWRQ